MAKKILLLMGSPRTAGNTDLLADAFLRGAEAAGNLVQKHKVAQMNIAPCISCKACVKEHVCAQKDDMEQIYRDFAVADVVVWASPVYYWFFSAQMKIVMDRLYAVGNHQGEITDTKECFLLMTTGSTDEKMFSQAVSYYQFGVERKGWTDRGMLLIGGVPGKGWIKRTEGLARAEEMGWGID